MLWAVSHFHCVIFFALSALETPSVLVVKILVHNDLSGMSRDHFWSICTYPFSTNIGPNGQLLMPNLVDLVLL